jgi:hypothetical protein
MEPEQFIQDLAMRKLIALMVDSCHRMHKIGILNPFETEFGFENPKSPDQNEYFKLSLVRIQKPVAVQAEAEEFQKYFDHTTKEKTNET